MSKKPPYLEDNPWVDILQQRGKDSGHPAQNPAKPSGLRHKPSSDKSQSQHSAAQRRGGPRRTKAEVEARRRQVFQLYLVGMNGDEIASQLKYPRRTIYSDLEHLKQLLKVEFHKERVFAFNRAVAQLDLMWREIWRIFYAPTLSDQDPSFRKMAAMDRMLKILRDRNALLELTPVVQPVYGDSTAGLVTPLRFEEQVSLETERIRAAEGRNQTESLPSSV